MLAVTTAHLFAEARAGITAKTIAAAIIPAATISNFFSGTGPATYASAPGSFQDGTIARRALLRLSSRPRLTFRLPAQTPAPLGHNAQRLLTIPILATRSKAFTDFVSKSPRQNGSGIRDKDKSHASSQLKRRLIGWNLSTDTLHPRGRRNQNAYLLGCLR